MKVKIEFKPGKALIRLGNACNNSCVFCHGGGASRNKRMELATEECERRIALAANAGAGMVVFSGGEPTIRKDIFDLCKFAAGLGLESGVITNGRMLSYRYFAARLAKAGVRYFLISLHGDNAETHNVLSNSDSFHQTILGIKNAASLGADLTINTVLTRTNSSRLCDISNLLESFAPLRHKISLPEPKGLAIENFQLALSPAEASEAAIHLLEKASSLRGVQIGFDGFTPCLIKDYFSLNDDLFTHGFCMSMDIRDETFFPPDHGIRSYPGACLNCSVKHVCPGIYSEYFRWFPDFSPEPLRRPVSNSIRFDLRETLPCGGIEDACHAPFMSGLSAWRGLAVKAGKKISLYETGEAKTCAPELYKIKRDLEQAYLCDTSSLISDIAPTHLVKLEIIAKCRQCARRFSCPGIFKKSAKNPYEKIIAETLSMAEAFRGRLLEIGCGDGPFFELFKSQIRGGLLSFYAGVDPEIARDEDSDDGRFALRKSDAENFEWSGEPFDCVAMFRSYHHIFDLDRAMASIRGAMKPGASLIITEDYKHIELHNEPDSRPTVSGDHGQRFQHFRNHSERDASLVLQKHCFNIRSIRSVAPDSAPVWIIVAEKPL